MDNGQFLQKNLFRRQHLPLQSIWTIQIIVQFWARPRNKATDNRPFWKRTNLSKSIILSTLDIQWLLPYITIWLGHLAMSHCLEAEKRKNISRRASKLSNWSGRIQWPHGKRASNLGVSKSHLLLGTTMFLTPNVSVHLNFFSTSPKWLEAITKDWHSIQPKRRRSRDEAQLF